MLSEWLHYQGKAGFLFEFLKWHFLKYRQVWTRRIFAQIVTYIRIVMASVKQYKLITLFIIQYNHYNNIIISLSLQAWPCSAISDKINDKFNASI